MKIEIAIFIGLFMIGCSTTNTLEPPTVQTTPPTQNVVQTPVISTSQTSPKESDKQSLLINMIEDEEIRQKSLEKKQHDKQEVDDAYDQEDGKDSKDQDWKRVIVLAEQYLSKYREVDEDFLNVESTIILCLFRLNQYEVLLKFVDSSAIITKSLLSDLNRAYALFMKGWALQRLIRNTEARVEFTKIINEYPNSDKVKYAKQKLNVLNDFDNFWSEISALRNSGLPTTPPSLAGLGDIKFSMTMHDIKKIKPNSEFELCRENCETTATYGWLSWNDIIYDRSAQIHVQLSQARKIKTIAVLFSSQNNGGNSEFCSSFLRSVQFPLLKKYGDYTMVDGSSTWFLREGKIELWSDCREYEFIQGILTLTPDSGA